MKRKLAAVTARQLVVKPVPATNSALGIYICIVVVIIIVSVDGVVVVDVGLAVGISACGSVFTGAACAAAAVAGVPIVVGVVRLFGTLTVVCRAVMWWWWWWWW
jgi:hypothetical protein